MSELDLRRIGLALLFAYLQGVFGAALGVAFGPFIQRGIPGDSGIWELPLLVLAALFFALEVFPFLFVVLLPAAFVTLPLTYGAARYVTLPRWAATLLGVGFAIGIVFPLSAVTMGGGWTYPGEYGAVATVLGGVCLAQPIWRRCMRPRLRANASPQP